MLKNQKTYLQVKVLPKSSQQKVVKQSDGFFKIYLKSAPEKGKANKELIKVLSKYLAICQKQVKIIKGEHSRSKIIKII
ncbi:MAG: hypothetical protein COS76_02725 [Candidatus Portnoybacteria bacterium CG06_land_8_20_14_3_00_39_12]|uniref:UPF0235 protein COU83_02210 n=3 Tax=Candidatus Portnoyibacteriota TaxID=1817913 RepID=A0A2M8KFQ8_9BACT|nr:MAG: hypothetical protein AUJ33_00180 [Parcubacteria group bacterium CG1_02_40_25]PIU75072.1 MAG: hypothetical protein COS76_02725 [Candidatus Portnoybacteria bacterium CG06_land_8_20_14_3_00_39_12]PIZ71478.1 MAG: hypothetical protein COY09_00615 [Candidatus Portnoybacteria bacterium CG_4_10_14_0_2_um_filter_39_11]PJE58744.1 MAG: hypothetical protein COU83_02210 [Candidatus Portnoybacteria bacterium CG10_big_fil_rev_8_21_14_0_10_40_22]